MMKKGLFVFLILLLVNLNLYGDSHDNFKTLYIRLCNVFEKDGEMRNESFVFIDVPFHIFLSWSTDGRKMANLGVYKLSEMYKTYLSDKNVLLKLRYPEFHIRLTKKNRKTPTKMLNPSFYLRRKLLVKMMSMVSGYMPLEYTYREKQNVEYKIRIEDWWNGGQKESDRRFSNLFNNKCKFGKKDYFDKLRELGRASLKDIFLKIKKDQSDYIQTAMYLIEKYPQHNNLDKIYPAKTKVSDLSFAQCVKNLENYADNFKLYRQEDPKQIRWSIPSKEACWSWWKENWQDWIIPFPDQDYKAIEAEIIKADPTYIPLSKRKNKKL